jgi:hypothetical protein
MSKNFCNALIGASAAAMLAGALVAPANAMGGPGAFLAVHFPPPVCGGACIGTGGGVPHLSGNPGGGAPANGILVCSAAGCNFVAPPAGGGGGGGPAGGSGPTGPGG